MPETAEQKKKAAKKKAKEKGHGRNKVDKPTEEELEIQNYWERNATAMPVESFRWRVIAYKGNAAEGQRIATLDPMVTSMSWEDAVIQKMSLTLTNPTKKLNLMEGHKISVFWTTRSGGKWTKLFTLRVNEVVIDVGEHSIQIDCSDELDWLKKSEDDFSYRKGKGKSPEKRVNGWRADQVTRDVCKRYGIKVGKIVKGRKILKNISEKKTNPLKIIEDVYKQESGETGFKYVISMRQGKLNVVRLRRSKELLIYGGTALSAQITRRMKAKMKTELNVTGKIKGKGDESKKKEITVQASPAIRRRFGLIKGTWANDEEVDSEAELRRDARMEMIEQMEPEREISLQVPGFPGLRRGDALKMAMPDEAFVELLYVKGATHSVSPGSYTVDLTLSFDEYYIDKEGEAAREKICKKAKKNKRKGPWFCDDEADVFAPGKPRPTKSKNKGDAVKKKVKS